MACYSIKSHVIPSTSQHIPQTGTKIGLFPSRWASAWIQMSLSLTLTRRPRQAGPGWLPRGSRGLGLCDRAPLPVPDCNWGPGPQGHCHGRESSSSRAPASQLGSGAGPGFTRLYHGYAGGCCKPAIDNGDSDSNQPETVTVSVGHESRVTVTCGTLGHCYIAGFWLYSTLAR